MGWSDIHLHRFRTGSDHRSPYFVTHFDLEEGEDGTLEDEVRLDQLIAEKGDELWYEYEFGDGWEHKLLVEEVLDEPPSASRCAGGRGGLSTAGLRWHRRRRGAGCLGPRWVRRRAAGASAGPRK
jgi:hypothetical protein